MGEHISRAVFRQEVAAMTTTIGDRAVVLGGSMAGLLAARVLSEKFREVIVVERDPLPESATRRRGTPQDRHIHGLAARGQQVLDELFPGFTRDMQAQGVPVLDQLADARLYFSGHRLQQGTSGVTIVCASRPFLEAYVRTRVRALPAVTVLDCCNSVGLMTTDDRSRVVGARIFRRADGSTSEELEADLVVDATGRGSRLPVWLQDLGYEAPAEEKTPIRVGYATRIYSLASSALSPEHAVITAPTPQHPRGAGLSTLEGGRLLVTLMGILGDYPPTDPDGFLAFARSLQFPDVYDVIRDAEPLEDPVAARFPASTRHRYERLHAFPEGLLVTGDAVCSFNPIYGQGMTVAALDALAIRAHLEKNGRGRPQDYLRRIAKVIDIPWDMAAGGDLAYPGVEGIRTRKIRMGNAYIPRVAAAAEHNAAVGAAFLRVATMTRRPETLFSPAVSLRVLATALRLRTPFPRPMSHRFSSREPM
ncbi:MAG: FAD-binding monooxygenase [Rhodococcus sp.]|nr:FAD-binding monooxygenase [Rhodococcus sp. (in: high G+C Gram-positive bacteria)]